jgi:hypothetical protein
MSLDVFDIKLGTDVMPRLDAENTGLVAVKMLDAVQTIADVLTTNDGGQGWKVSFDPGLNAYTDRTSGKRSIVVSAKPMLDAKPGTPMANVAAIMTGFVVHEVGHTELDFFTAVKNRWPGKTLPLTLANIIEDVVLEERTCARYNGFADHGRGNIFRPTLEWVAELTSPKTPLTWSGSTGHKVNVTGQIVRYRDFVSFSEDKVTQTHLRWVEDEWMPGITADLTPKGCVELIERWLDHVKATLAEDEPEPEKPPVTDGPTGTSTDQSLPDEDDDGDTEGEDGGGEDGEDDGEAEGDGEDSDEDGDTEGDADSDSDDDTEGEGDDDSEESGSETGERGGDGNDADTLNRTEGGKGDTDSEGAGGSGQAIAEASDPIDDFVPEDLPQTFDELSKPDEGYEQQRIATAEGEERVTTRLDAGAYGRMRVIFR